MTDEISVSGGFVTLTDTQRIALDLEKQPTTASMISEKLDIEHSVVEDDPRRWSSRRKANSINY